MKAPLIVIGVLLAVPVLATTVDEVQKLSKAGVADDVIIAQIQADHSVFTLNADQILALKQAGISDKVLKAMIETRQPAAPKKEEAKADKPQTGRLSLSNDASEPYSVMVSPEARSVFFYYGRFQDRVVLEPGASRTLDVPPGAYTVRWVGEKAKFNAPVAAGGTTRVVATKLETADYAGLHVSILEGGSEGEHEADAGMLKVFREIPKVEPAPQAVVTVPQPYVLYGAYPPPPPAVPTVVHHHTPFIGPWTVLGAGVGAVIGNQSDERDRGAALGAVLGHFLDHASDE